MYMHVPKSTCTKYQNEAGANFAKNFSQKISPNLLNLCINKSFFIHPPLFCNALHDTLQQSNAANCKKGFDHVESTACIRTL